MNTQKSVKCPYCAITAEPGRRLNTHISILHPGKPYADVLEDGTYQFRDHKLGSPARSIPASRTMPVARNQPVPCPYCTRPFLPGKSLNSHIRLGHPGQKYAYPQADGSFIFSATKLENAYGPTRHKGSKPHGRKTQVCPYCDQKVKQMNHHIKLSHPGQPFVYSRADGSTFTSEKPLHGYYLQARLKKENANLPAADLQSDIPHAASHAVMPAHHTNGHDDSTTINLDAPAGPPLSEYQIEWLDKQPGGFDQALRRAVDAAMAPDRLNFCTNCGENLSVVKTAMRFASKQRS